MVKKIGIGVVVLALIIAFAFGLREKRTVTTRSAEAYREYQVGLEYLNKFYFEEALVSFKRAAELDTGFAMAYCRQGWIHQNFGRIEKATAALAKAAELASGATEKEQLIIAFHNANFNRDYDKANEVIEKVAERYPKAIEPYNYRGGQYFRQGKFEEAIHEYKRILELDPNYALAYCQLGYAYAYQGEFDQAVANLKKYVFLAPDQPNPHDSLGEIYLLMGRYDEAIAEFNKARRLKSDLVFVIDHLGQAYRHKGMYRKAIGYFEKSLTLSSSQWSRVNNFIEIARTYYEKGDYDKSLAVLEKTTAQGPQLIIIYWLMGLNYADQGATSQAEQIRALWTAEREKKGDEEIDKSWEMKYYHHLSGKIELAKGAYDRAIENFKKVLSYPLRPNKEVFFRTTLAEAFYKSDKLEEAIAELEKALEINPNYSLSRYLLARIYDEGGDLRRALAEMEKYLMIMDGCDEGVVKVEEIKKRLAEIKEAT